MSADPGRLASWLPLERKAQGRQTGVGKEIQQLARDSSRRVTTMSLNEHIRLIDSGALTQKTCSAMLGSILVLVEAPAVSQLIATALTEAGFATVHATDIAAAERLVNQFVPDVAVIDIDAEEFSPLAMESTRKLISSLPASVMLTDDKVRNCGNSRELCGAAVCMAKPFHPRQLVETVSSLVKNAIGGQGNLRLGNLMLVPRHHRVGVRVEGATHDLQLRPVEFRLLQVLMAAPDVVHGREELLGKVWTGGGARERTVDQTVRRIRRELERFQLTSMLQTVTGIGYRLSAT